MICRLLLGVMSDFWHKVWSLTLTEAGDKPHDPQRGFISWLWNFTCWQMITVTDVGSHQHISPFHIVARLKGHSQTSHCQLVGYFRPSRCSPSICNSDYLSQNVYWGQTRVDLHNVCVDLIQQKWTVVCRSSGPLNSFFSTRGLQSVCARSNVWKAFAIHSFIKGLPGH